MVIGLAGNAKSGKNSLADALISILKEYNIAAQEVSLALKLREELDPFLKSQFNISAFTKNPEEKELIRPILVEYAKIKRFRTKGSYFSSLLQPKIDELRHNNIISLVSDLRYINYDYPKDEYFWLKMNNGILIYVERILEDGSVVPPPNEEETKYNPILKGLSDYKIIWNTISDKQKHIEMAKEQLKPLINHILNWNNYGKFKDSIKTFWPENTNLVKEIAETQPINA